MIRGLNKITAFAGLGYVMSTYTKHPKGLDAAHEQAKVIAAELTAAGLVVFVPVAYGPPIEAMFDDGGSGYSKSHELWMPICERFYQRCDYGIIATTPGWQKSEGVAVELYALARKDVPLHFYDVEGKHIYNYAEAMKKWKSDVLAFEEFASRVVDQGYLSEVTEKYSEAVANGIGLRVIRNAAGSASPLAALPDMEKPRVN